jgi:hypothetical protein
VINPRIYMLVILLFFKCKSFKLLKDLLRFIVANISFE